jgi:hypothetical protein
MVDGAAPVTTRVDPALVKTLARALRYQRLLDEGRYTSIIEMAEAERIERGHLGSLLRLRLLAPASVEDLMEGRAGSAPSLAKLLRPFSDVWAHHRRRWRNRPMPVRPLGVHLGHSARYRTFPKRVVRLYVFDFRAAGNDRRWAVGQTDQTISIIASILSRAGR